MIMMTSIHLKIENEIRKADHLIIQKLTIIILLSNINHNSLFPHRTHLSINRIIVDQVHM